MKITYQKLEIKLSCPCGKEMVRSKETTGGYKCPDPFCWVFTDKEGNAWVGKPLVE